MSVQQYETQAGERRYRVRWRDPDGRMRSRSFEKKRDADAWDAQATLAVRAGERLDDRRDEGTPTVAAWAETWLDRLGRRVRIGDLTHRTATGYESALRLHVLPRLGHLRLDRLRVSDVDTLLADLQEQGLSGGTARHVRATLSALLTEAERDDLVVRNVARSSRPPRMRRTEVTTFDDDELARIVHACQDHPLGLLFLFIASTGMRTSEALGLRWEDVDLDDASFVVTGGMHRIARGSAKRLGIEHGNVRSSRGKNESSEARTPLSPAAVDLLRQQRRRQAADRLAAPVWADTDAVFASEVGTHLDAGNARRAWKQLLAEADVAYEVSGRSNGRGLHELRRTWATRMLAGGADLDVVQRLGRWSTPTMLLSRYANASDRLRDAASLGDLPALG